MRMFKDRETAPRCMKCDEIATHSAIHAFQFGMWCLEHIESLLESAEKAGLYSTSHTVEIINQEALNRQLELAKRGDNEV